MDNIYEAKIKPKLNQIYKWRKQGKTEMNIARKLGIDYCDLLNLQEEYPELENALERGRDELLDMLTDTFYKNAMGYEYEENKTYIARDENGKEKRVVEKIKKHKEADAKLLLMAINKLDPAFSKQT